MGGMQMPQSEDDDLTEEEKVQVQQVRDQQQ